MSATGEEAPRAHQRDWLPWVIVAILALVVGAMILVARRGKDEVAERTRKTGLALTAEQKAVRFDSADLSFEIDPAARAIRGTAAHKLRVLAPIERIQFDLDPRYAIRSVAVDGAVLPKDAYANDGGLLSIALPAAKRAGDQLAVTIAYGGKPHVATRAPWDGGFVWARTEDGQPWVASAIQGEGCDLLWPCFDNSRVEIGTVTQHITVPKGLKAPSNGRLLGVDRLEDGRTRWNWVARSPNNYAISINVAPYALLKADHQSRFGNRFPIEYWYLPGKERDAKARVLFAEMAQTVDFFEDVIGPYPFGDEKVGAVETPHLGMEHQTINAYGNNYKPAPYGYDWLFNHEFAHEWFGNQLTNGDWDDMWLHEGFGTYMQPLTVQWLRGDQAYQALLWEYRAQLLNKNPMVTGKSRVEHDVYDEKTGPGLDIYRKGAWILHTLRGEIGDEAFFRAVRRLVYGRADPAPGNFKPRFGSSVEFQQIVAEEAGRDMGWFFDAYLRHAKLPELVETRTADRLTLAWKLPGNRPFPMPVEVRIDGTVQRLAMTDGRGAIALPRPQSLVTIDPAGKLLRQSTAMDAYRDWLKANGGKK